MTYQFSGPIIAFSTERNCVDAAAPYDGFNVTHYSDDSREHVSQCREQLCARLGILQSHLIVPRQVHGVRIDEVTKENLDDPFDNIDALITRTPGVCIGVSTADCVPLLFHDCRTHAVAAAHAGWRGTVAGIARLTIKAMHDTFGTCPENVECAIGPSIGPEAFEVGDEVYEAFAYANFPMTDIAFRSPLTNKWHIDLWQANKWLLTEAGVPEESVHVSSLCTYTNYSRFFSARRLGIQSGRIFTGMIITECENPSMSQSYKI
ncbi:MAG: peptidoglycan editing factor PgeF [Bacteroidaceae bacterium]|nr:peptidoglycan editing factor PgeF [Bacteroidaceae bacterium]